MQTVQEREEKVYTAIEIAIKVGILALVIYISYLIVKPFIGVIVWGIIIAVALSPLIDILQKYLKNRKRVIVGVTITMVTMLIVPTYMLSGTVISSSSTVAHSIKEGNVTIPPPTQKVKQWPVIGEKVYNFWSSASSNLEKTLAPFKEDIKKLTGFILKTLGSGIGTIFMFIGSFIIASIFLFHQESSTRLYENILHRLVGERAKEWVKLSTLTIRSVMVGVIGVAVIQAVFALIGLLLMDIPFAIVWGVLIMFLTIIQLPALIVIGPIIAYVFSLGSGTSEMIFTVYMLIVGASDGVLKPILMGRGVDIPMLIILIGAIGGMMLMGMIGLFIGAVIFALAYKLFGLWMSEDSRTI